MVLRRPDKRPGSPAAEAGKPDIQLMEELVKKSLDVNPALGGGRDAKQVIASFKEEASGAARTSPGAMPPPRASLAERRKATIKFFLEQKQEELEELSADITAREKLLAEERRQLQQRVYEEVVDFLALVSGGTESQEAREAVHECRSFIAELGVTEIDVIKGAQKRR